MKYMVGLKTTDKNLLECIRNNKEHIYEVYFSWGDFLDFLSLSFLPLNLALQCVLLSHSVVSSSLQPH